MRIWLHTWLLQSLSHPSLPPRAEPAGQGWQRLGLSRDSSRSGQVWSFCNQPPSRLHPSKAGSFTKTVQVLSCCSAFSLSCLDASCIEILHDWGKWEETCGFPWHYSKAIQCPQYLLPLHFLTIRLEVWPTARASQNPGILATVDGQIWKIKCKPSLFSDKFCKLFDKYSSTLTCTIIF